MSNYKKTIETQKAINDAVEAIFAHFKNVVSYAETLETMTEAQVELMEINRHVAACPSLGMESVPTSEIATFVYEANEAYKLLRPFAKLIGQVYGNEE